MEHRLDRLHITGAAADHARKRLAHFGLAGIRVLLQQSLGSQDLRRGAVAALDGAAFDKCLLQDVQTGRKFPALLGVLSHRLDRLDGMPFRLGRQQQARVHRLAIQQHRAGPTFAVITAVLDAVIAQAAQYIQQAVARCDHKFVQCAIDAQ